jgi:small-conductance mechanosensitive channel
MIIQQYLEMLIDWALTNGLQIILVLILTFVALKFTNFFVERFFTGLIRKKTDSEIEKRTHTLKSITKSSLDVIIICVGVVIILAKIGIEIGPILAAAGVLGVAVGFGSQRFIEDIISGFIIILEDQIRVGDVVQIGDKGGLVEKVDIKMVVLRDLAGNVHYIRCGKIDTVTNMTKDYSRYVFDIGVAYRENVDEVIEVIKQVDEDLRNDEEFKDVILEPMEILGLDKFDDSAVIIKARTKTKPIMQWSVAREFNRRLKKRFDEVGIEIPFPHRTLYIGQDKQGKSPVLNINMEK